jgi:hypothetical protein
LRRFEEIVPVTSTGLMNRRRSEIRLAVLEGKQ